MKKFKFKFKKSGALFWKTRIVTGSRMEKEIDRMVLFFEDGGIEEITNWSKYDARLGVDWVLAIKDQMEKEAGQAIKLNV